ncbi:WD40-repeat-containing domain protein [Rhodocollybia butyracea]|uniref:WD40-repeat-containing domain protein n=1 Tax=Rhodocollybia butyracea TaxID=206335 RepID=A0A9P5Q5I2_9AGAR|nr:WD40-repeat-containing domain protein [Rhodocollybia butyracea]
MDDEHASNPEQRTGGAGSLSDDSRRNIQTLLNMLRASSSRPSANMSTTFATSTIAEFLGSADDDDDFLTVQVEDQEEDQEEEGDGEYMDVDDDIEDIDDGWYPTSRTVFTFPPATTPQPAGVSLIKSGDFGRVGPKIKARRNNRNLAAVLGNQLTSPHPALYKEDYATNIVPNSNGVIVANYDANIYTAQYSKDASFFYTCAQDFRLHIYDTTAPPQRAGSQIGSGYDHHLQTTMNVSRRIQGEHGRWTITDANLSPDNDRIIYSSITSTAYMCSTRDDNPAQIPIPFHDNAGPRLGWDYSGPGSFGLFSCRFSADGNEVIAGGRGHIYVYDLLANKRSVKILAHNDDVNSCAWAEASGNVLVSASDDTFLKVWDRRSLGSSPKPSGVLIGHTEGITYVSAKGDGRYIISNGKDQAMRLWDLRKMRSNDEYDQAAHIDYGVPNFDYRYPSYPKPKYKAHPLDCSVMTYRGHSVLMTLIRCHFSPETTTGGQYLYSGSADGRVHVWSLDGTVVQVLDRQKTLPIWADPSGVESPSRTNRIHGSCVRDVSWSSQQPVLISAAWESIRHGSTLAKHEWKGLSKLSNKLEDWEEKRHQEQAEGGSRRSTRIQQQALRRPMPGTYSLDDSDDEEPSD